MWTGRQDQGAQELGMRGDRSMWERGTETGADIEDGSRSRIRKEEQRWLGQDRD